MRSMVLISMSSLPFLFSVPVLPSDDAGLVTEMATVRFDWSAAGSGRTAMPRFSRGMLAISHLEGNTTTSISLFSRDGQAAARIQFEIPDAQRTILSSGGIAPLPDGSGYVAVAVAVNGSRRARPLCFLDAKGKLLKVVPTDPFLPVLITVAADGTIWAVGATNSDDVPESDDPVLRRFSGAGELLGTALPRRLFGQEPPQSHSPESGVAVLTSTGSRVVFYSPHTRQLFEFGLDGAMIAAHVLPLVLADLPDKTASKPLTLTGLALMEQGNIYADLSGGRNRGLHELDRAGPRWVPLHPEDQERFRDYSLLGSDGNQLVLCPIGPRGVTLDVTWIRPTPRFAP